MSTSVSKKKYIHSAIGLILMFSIGFLPPVEPLTKAGMYIGGIFIGLLYLWTMVDILWPSLLGLAVLALSDLTNISGVLASSFGNSTVILMIFILALVGVIEYGGIPAYIVQWIMSRKVIEGRPWVFTTVILLGTYITSVMIALAAAFLFWSILYKLFEDIGYKKGDKYTKLLLFGVIYATGLGTFLMPFQGMGLILTGTLLSVLPDASVEYVPYIIVHLALAVLSILIWVFAMKFIFRADVTLLKQVKVEMFTQNKLPPMSKLQKFLLYYLVLTIVLLLLPGFLPKTWIVTQKMLSLGPCGTVILLFAVLGIIQVDGHSLVNFRDLAYQKITWELVFLCAVALTISPLLTNADTGITTLLFKFLNPLFLGKSSIVFIILLCLLTVVLTNVANNGVIGVIMVNLSCMYVLNYNINPAVAVIIICYCSNIAFLLPASSMFGAVAHGNKDWLSAKDIYVYAVFVAAVGIILPAFVGYPLALVLV